MTATAYPQVVGVGWHIAKLLLQSEPAGLDRVLTQMDNAAKTFRTAQADPLPSNTPRWSTKRKRKRAGYISSGTAAM